MPSEARSIIQVRARSDTVVSHGRMTTTPDYGPRLGIINQRSHTIASAAVLSVFSQRFAARLLSVPTRKSASEPADPNQS